VDGHIPFKSSTCCLCALLSLTLILFSVFHPVVAFSATYRVNFEVVDSQQGAIPAKLVFLGLDANNEIDYSLTPSFNQLDYNPGGGDYFAGSENVLLSATGIAHAELESGTYLVVANRGIEYSIAGDTLRLPEMANTNRVFVLEHLLDVPGRISADFHVHSDSSGDSKGVAITWGFTRAYPPQRVIDFLTSGVELINASDHHQMVDLNPAIQLLENDIAQLGGYPQGYITKKVATMMSGEFALLVKVEGDPPDCPPAEFPPDVAHFNAWPLNQEGQGPDVCDDVYRQPATLYDILRAIAPDSTGHRKIIQLDHPRGAHYDWEHEPGFIGGPHLGWFENWGYDPTQPIPPYDDGGPNSFLRIVSELSSTQNINFDVIEILNRNYMPYYMKSRDDWFSFLNQGFNKVATGNTDSHWIFLDGCGYPRNYVASNLTSMEVFGTEQENALVDSILHGDVLVTTGPIIDFTMDGKGLGDTVYVSAQQRGRVNISVTVKAAPWVPMQQVRFIVNGETIYQRNIGDTNPDNPFSTDPADVVRLDRSFRYNFTQNSWAIVEAGIKLPAPGVQPPAYGLYKHIAADHRVVSFTNPIYVKFNVPQDLKGD